MWEKLLSPSSVCSGFVKRPLFRVSLAWLSRHSPGWRGVPRFSENHDDTVPMTCRFTTSSVAFMTCDAAVSVVGEPVFLIAPVDNAAMEFSSSGAFRISCIFSTSFLWTWPRDCICCLKFNYSIVIHNTEANLLLFAMLCNASWFLLHTYSTLYYMYSKTWVKNMSKRIV